MKDNENEKETVEDINAGQEKNTSKQKKEETSKKKSKEKSKAEDTETKLCKQLKEKDEQLIRVAAEYDNFRKRSAKEKEDNFLNAKVSVISDFLDVIDNFQRAKDARCELEDYKKGVELIFNQFYEKMSKLGVEQFGEVGEQFNPEIHMAVMHTDDDEKGENEITEVFQSGYKIGERIVRHAMVKVAN